MDREPDVEEVCETLRDDVESKRVEIMMLKKVNREQLVRLCEQDLKITYFEGKLNEAG